MITELEALRKKGAVAVLLSARWAAYANPEPLSAMDARLFPAGFSPGKTIMSDSLRTTLQHLDSIHVPTGLLQQVPEQELDVPRCLEKRAPSYCETLGTVQDLYLTDARSLLSAASAVSAHTLVFDPALHMCRSGHCKVTVGDVRLYHDDNHLTPEGALALAPLLTDFATALTSLALETSKPRALAPTDRSVSHVSAQ